MDELDLQLADTLKTGIVLWAGDDRYWIKCSTLAAVYGHVGSYVQLLLNQLNKQVNVNTIQWRWFSEPELDAAVNWKPTIKIYSQCTDKTTECTL